MNKRTLSIAFYATFAISLVAAAGRTDQKQKNAIPPTLKVAAIAGPSGLGMARLFTETPDVGAGTTVTFEAVASVDLLLPKLVNGDADIGILPPNVAAKLYTMNPRSVVAGAVVGNSMLALVTRDPAVKTIADLAGKTVSVAGQGSTPEFVFRTLLKKAGLGEGAVTLDFSLPTQEIAAALVSDRIRYALVPEPFATVAVMNGAAGTNPVHRAILLRDEWSSSGFGSDFPMTLAVIRTGYAEQYPATVRKFLEAYKETIAWTQANPAEAGKFAESAGLGLKAPIAAKAIPSCNFVYMDATSGRASIETLLSVFLEYAPAAVGGKLPGDSFYFR